MSRESLGTPVDCIAFEQITVDDTSGGKGLTAAKYARARYAIAQVETAEIRFTREGTAPTTTVGVLGEPYDLIYINQNDFANFKAIRTSGTSGQLNVEYFK